MAAKKKRFNLKEQYSLSWKYLKESRNFIYASILIFVVFAVIGFLLPIPESYSKIILDYLREIVQKTENLSQLGLIRFILLNNLQSSFSGFIFGFFLGILPLFALIFNGYILGFVSAIAVETSGFSTLLSLLPHGIFELPAIFISLGLGMKFGFFIFKKNPGKSFRKFLWEGLRVFVFVVIPLLIIAAIIEGSLIAIQ